MQYFSADLTVPAVNKTQKSEDGCNDNGFVLFLVKCLHTVHKSLMYPAVQVSGVPIIKIKAYLSHQNL